MTSAVIPAAEARLLECRGLSVRFGGLMALNELDIDVGRGEVLGLIGPNGSGKTTFFNVVSGVYAASAGSIRLDGVDVTSAKAQNLSAHGLARTFQRSRLCLPLSVFDNIALGAQGRLNSGLWHNLFRRKAFADEARTMAAEARELLHVFSPTLADKLFEPAISLGMIDRRRVEICRALIGRPKLVLLDEPSAGMTHDETDQLMDEILGVRRSLGDLTIIIVEHEMGLIERVTDRCVVLNYGKKICEGRFRDVAADPVVREAYLGQS
ncbi:MAG: ABC transporter ATP-binding protein [Phreatobacter sp.]